MKLKPTKEQEERFSSWLGACRLTYNMCLDIKNQTYKKRGKNITKHDLQKQITDLRSCTEFPWYSDVHSQVMQDVTDRVERTFKTFFSGGGYPKFAKKNYYDSFTFKQGIKIHPNTKKVVLPKIGKVKFYMSEKIEGEIKTCTIKREVDGWYMCLVTEQDMQPINQNMNIVGLDLGLTDYIVSSDAEFVKNPKFLYKYEEKLKKMQRQLARMKKGSKNFKKKVIQIRKLYLKIRNIKNDFLHKLSTKIVNENQVVIMEKLKIQNMMKNHCLAKSIQDASWGRFMGFVKYKCEWQGKIFLQIDPKNTTTDCNKCDYRNENLTLADREWTCPSCGEKHQRDENSSLVVKKRGIQILKESGLDFSTLKYKPSEEILVTEISLSKK